jgi:hypothetical protein
MADIFPQSERNANAERVVMAEIPPQGFVQKQVPD